MNRNMADVTNIAQAIITDFVYYFKMFKLATFKLRVYTMLL